MPWIDIINQDEATGDLKKLYSQIENPDGSIDNVVKIHSLRPRTLYAHLLLYKAVLHTKPNELSNRERELIGTYTSHLNGCHYCVQHHKAGLSRHIGNSELADELLNCLADDIKSENLTAREIVFSKYTYKLSMIPQDMNEEDILELKKVGLTSAGILDLNQIIAYFAYVNRMVNGLGVETAGETLGFHPNEDSDGFVHK